MVEAYLLTILWQGSDHSGCYWKKPNIWCEEILPDGHNFQTFSEVFILAFNQQADVEEHNVPVQQRFSSASVSLCGTGKCLLSFDSVIVL